ncbi:aminoglycoside phosphotransferase family protein [Streptomyces coeruleorubidus]|uniref:aminoglycoside phosphotransferase family protein n=1 Tax=Streptomyces coeruleorubidus TaxID=116188 RepID=UPI0033E135FC
MRSYERGLPVRHKDALLAVLRGLASVPGTDAMRRLTVQDDRPLWQGHDRFQDALAALVARALARHGAALAARVPGFDAGVERTLNALRSLPDAPVTAIHGDPVPPNIHVDTAGRPVAVLDFGFCTTAGDPAFEAAVTAAVCDMYGPHAQEHTAELTRLFARELGYSPAALTAYQAAYASPPTTCSAWTTTTDTSGGVPGSCVATVYSGRRNGRKHSAWPSSTPPRSIRPSWNCSPPGCRPVRGTAAARPKRS